MKTEKLFHSAKKALLILQYTEIIIGRPVILLDIKKTKDIYGLIQAL
jgi:hypothetical protein